MIGQLTSVTIQLLVIQIAEVASSFTTRQWKGNHGCLVLVLNVNQIIFTSGIGNLDCSPLDQPDVINPAITNDTKNLELLALQ